MSTGDQIQVTAEPPSQPVSIFAANTGIVEVCLGLLLRMFLGKQFIKIDF